MFLVSTAGLDEDEALGTLGLLFAQSFALPVLDRQGVGILVHVFERGQDFTHILLHDFVERSDLIKARECQDNGVRRNRHHWGQDRDTSHNPESAFSTNK